VWPRTLAIEAPQNILCQGGIGLPWSGRQAIDCENRVSCWLSSAVSRAHTSFAMMSVKVKFDVPQLGALTISMSIHFPGWRA
jgi:hypothetical protein